jgi:outer membrane immunogenic protein
MRIKSIYRLAMMTAALSTIGFAAVAGDGYGPVEAPAPIWTGLYIGGHGGYVSARATAGNVGLDLNGAVGGLHAGYQFQTGTIVFGIEGDVGISGAEYNARYGTLAATVSVDRLASIRGRAGLAMGSAMLYATGGIAFAHGDITISDSASGLKASASIESTGYVVGGGVEARLTERISGRVEGLYYGFSDLKLAGISTKVELPTTAVRGGLSYRFN